MRKITIAFLILALILFGCSETQITKDTRYKKKLPAGEKLPELKNVTIKKLYAWVDLMPGSEPRFNISGDLTFVNKPGINLDKLKLKYIKIYQNKNRIFFIKPTTRENVPDNSDLKILFSTIKGMILTPGFNYNKQIDVKLIFVDDGDEFEKVIENVPIEKVY